MNLFIYHIIVRDKANKDKVCDFHAIGVDHHFVCDKALALAIKIKGFTDPYIDMLSVLGEKDF